MRKLFPVLTLSKHTKKGNTPWLLWVAFGIHGEGLDWKTREHGNCDLPASSAGWCICTQVPEAVSLPGSYSLLPELVSGVTIAFLRQFYPWLLSLCLWCSCNHSSHFCLDTCLFIPDSGSWPGFTFLHSFILVCSAFRSLICRKYSLPVSSMLMNSWSCMSLATQGLSNDPDHTYHHIADWRESNKFKLKSLVVATYVTILRYEDGIFK